MKIEQTTLHKTFTVVYKGKRYYVDYINSDGETLSLFNRDNWEIYDEYSEELQIYTYYEKTKKEKRDMKANRDIFRKLVGFCLNHFEDYKPIKVKN